MEEAKRRALQQYQEFNQRRIEDGDEQAEKEFEEEIRRMLPKDREDEK